MLNVGSFDLVVPADCRIKAEGQSEFNVLVLENGNPVKMIARSVERLADFKVREEIEVRFEIEGQNFISVDVMPVKALFDKSDPVPFEIPDDMKPNLTLEEKLKVYLSEMVAERYGALSEEYDTFEDSMDFGPEETVALSGYEVKDVVPEEPVTTENPTAPEPPPAEEVTPPGETTTP